MPTSVSKERINWRSDLDQDRTLAGDPSLIVKCPNLLEVPFTISRALLERPGAQEFNSLLSNPTSFATGINVAFRTRGNQNVVCWGSAVRYKPPQLSMDGAEI